MRARNIKKEFWENEEVADCDPIARLLFIGLWCYADKEGLFEWRPKRIKALIFPYDGFKIDKYLDELLEIGLIKKYVAEGQYYGNVVNFKKHQKPHPHEAKSKIPECPIIEGENPKLNQCDDMVLHCNDNDTPTHTNVSECKSDILILGKMKDDVRKEDIRKEDMLITSNLTFDDWWGLYPRKVNKQKAIEAWKKIKPDQNLIMKMIGAIDIQKTSKEWTKDGGQFIPHPTTWLNGGRWDDELEIEVQRQPYSDTTAKNIKMFNEWNPEG